MELNFDNRHVVITGGTGALGTAVTQMLLTNGARCSIPCYDESELDTFPFSSSDEHLFLQTGVDLTDEAKTSSFYKKAINEQGPLWGSLHLAGGFGMGKIGDTALDLFLKQINLNLITCYNACRSAVAGFRESRQGGRIVNVAARPALEPRQGKGMSAYTTSKAGVAALTQSLAQELANEDILVNAVAPSVIDTPDNRKSMPDADFDKWPKPKELAAQILWLASPQNSITRGAIVTLYGKS